MTEDIRTDEPVRGKILKFPSLIAERDASAIALPASGSAVPTLAPTAPSGTPSAFQRLAAVRRRRSDRAVAEGEPAGRTTKVPSTRPNVAQLVTWLLNLRKGGVGFLYWNAAKLPIEVALVRAARLDDDAIVDVVGHRILVVEPLHPRRAPEIPTTGAEAVLP